MATLTPNNGACFSKKNFFKDILCSYLGITHTVEPMVDEDLSDEQVYQLLKDSEQRLKIDDQPQNLKRNPTLSSLQKWYVLYH